MRFETVFIRRSSDTHGAIPSPSSSGFIANGAAVEDLIIWGYGLPTSSTWPSARPWAILDASRVRGVRTMSERFDIRAKAPFQSHETPRGSLGPFHYMVQATLADRFSLQVHWEMRERPVYVLHSPESGLRGLGRGIRQSPLGCDRPKRNEVPPAFDLPSTPGEPVWPRYCGLTSTGQLTVPATPPPSSGSIAAGGIPMSTLTQRLESWLRAEVIDSTGLPGTFDVVLRFGPNESLEEALRDQLGLRLEERKAPGDVLVIDKVGAPTID